MVSAPSSSEYDECTCRCTKPGSGTSGPRESVRETVGARGAQVHTADRVTPAFPRLPAGHAALTSRGGGGPMRRFAKPGWKRPVNGKGCRSGSREPDGEMTCH